MPYSSNTFDAEILKHLECWNYQTFLDIGAGAGKYGKLIRKVSPNSHTTAIEIEREYIERFQLRNLYNIVYQCNGVDLINGNQHTTYDVVILGDTIEHLKKSDGIDLLHFLVYRSKRIIVVYPSKYVQFDTKDKLSESHRSIWHPSDFTHFEHTHVQKGRNNLVVINGYLGDPEAIIRPRN